MLIKPTKGNLKKLEALFREFDYKVRYEKGHFQSGYCIVNHQKVIIINKFYKIDARIRCLLDILKIVDFPKTELSEESQALYDKLAPSLKETED